MGPVKDQAVLTPGRTRRWYWGVIRQLSISEASPMRSWVSPSRDSLMPKNSLIAKILALSDPITVATLSFHAPFYVPAPAGARVR